MQDTVDAPVASVPLLRENEELRAELARLHLLLARADLEAERRAQDAVDEALHRQSGELERLRERLAATESAKGAVLASGAAIARSAERLRAVMESASDHAVIAMDLAGRITLWSRGAEAVLGWPASEALGQDAGMIFTPEDQAAGVPQQEMAAALANGRAQDERWHRRCDGTRFWARGGLVPLRGAEGTSQEGRINGYLKILRDRTEEKRAEEQARLLGDELQHRVKNTLSLVQAVVRQSLRGAAPTDALGIIEARLAAMGRAHDVLTRGGWTGTDLRAAVDDALRPHDDGAPGRFRLEGPPVALPAQSAMHLALVLHELATNAAKYGALSVPDGHVAVEWAVDRVEASAAGPGEDSGTSKGRFHLTWQEHGGPRVVPPARRGFGSRLIERGLASVFGGRATLSYAHDGVRCEVEGRLSAFLPGAVAGGAAAGG